ECISAVEDTFRQHALGKAPAPGILGLHAEYGSFHIKAALLTLGEPYFAAKTNANFPHNGARHGLPTIQGVVVLCEAVTGQPLAVMDSMAITALRTAAATAVAAKSWRGRTAGQRSSAAAAARRRRNCGRCCGCAASSASTPATRTLKKPGRSQPRSVPKRGFRLPPSPTCRARSRKATSS